MTDKNYEYENWKLSSDNTKNPKQKNDLHRILFWLFMIFSPLVLLYGLFEIALFNNRELTILNLDITFLIVILVTLYIYFISPLTRNNFLRILLTVLIGVALSTLIYFLPDFIAYIFRIGTALLGLTISGFMFANIWRNLYDKLSWFSSFIWGAVYLILNLFILFSHYGFEILAVLSGAYLVFFSLSYLYLAIKYLISKKDHSTSSFIVTLPTFLTAFLPGAIFRDYNMLIRTDPALILDLQKPLDEPEPDVIIYIHTRPGFVRDLGHCDICVDGVVYSFGDYDRSSWRLGGYFSDGVMAIIDPQKQIKMALGDNKKILLAYGLSLTPEMKQQIKDELNSIMSKSYRWKCKAELATPEEIKKNPKEFQDSGSQMYLESGAVFYKFKEKSKYRIYCGTNMNCATLVNDVIAKIGLHLFRFTDIISPGNYFEFLDELYLMPNTIVTGRRLYSLDKDGKPVIYPSRPAKPFKFNQG